ncbi:hypothetical protein BGW41_006099 [Actinomortierella wolfii]|nr:hypothetical protein BGW41_006099 [Actinomortierella wolfii]
MAPLLPTATKASSAVLSKAIENKDVHFQVLYFPVHALAELIRTILAYSDAKWEHLELEWPKMKEHTPFRVVPLVYEYHADGTVIQLAESSAIERYLARKFDLFGDNAWEAYLVDMYFNNSLTVFNNMVSKFLRVNGDDKEKRVEAYNKVVDEDIERWVQLHEEHLMANGNNGHYVGDRTSLADLMALVTLYRIETYRPKGAKSVNISREATPALWKLKETLESTPSLAQWIASEQYKKLSATTATIFKF